MAYQALYRVWRSQRFEDVVGQKAITQTLKNAILQDQISHAYLFTGPRGTGKTSAAKIFAKAINCPNSQDGEPCNECEMCRSITEGNQEDVIEIDAASNNGVEEIRFIRDRANYAPTQAKYKVYIIDEVHMLSTGAFNALLKTLEEPRKNVVFILATTEPHKIPATIISRTQRFDFKRIATKDIIEHLAHILAENQIDYEGEALAVIARAAEGGMRDALSILDQAIAFSDGKITMQNALDVTGSLTYEMMDDYLRHCLEKDVASALTDLDLMLSAGKEARRLLENLLVYCRDLLLYQSAPKLLRDQTAHLTEAFQQLAKETPQTTIFHWIDILSQTQNDVRFTNSPTIYLEVATVKLAEPPAAIRGGTEDSMGNSRATKLDNPVSTNDSAVLTQLQQQVAQLQKELAQLKQAEPVGTAPVKTAAKPKNATNYRIPRERVFQVLEKATKQNLENVKQVWEDLLMSLSVTQRAVLRSSQPRAASSEGVVIAFDYEIVCQKAANDNELSLAIHNNLSRMISDYAPEAVYITEESWPQLRQDFLKGNHTNTVAPEDQPDFGETPQTEETLSDNNEVVEKAQELFGDLATIIED